MNFGAILAGGIGARMHISDMPKQFLPLGGRPIIVQTLEKLLACPRLDRVYVGVHPDWTGYMEELTEQYAPQAVERVRVVPGGTDRTGTIMAILAAIEEDFGQEERHIIVTHDAVRPFVTLRMIEENIDAAADCGAADTVTAAVDTIVVSDDGQVIADIPPRKRMYQGQTPQSFQVGLLKRLYASLTADERASLTDACGLCVARGVPVRLVEGDVTNLKITTAADYRIAQAMVEGAGLD